MSKAKFVVLVVTLIFVTIAPGPAQAAQTEVSILDNVFNPSAVITGSGDVVRWTHNSFNPHTVTADDGSFDSSPGAALSSGQTFSVTITGPAREVRYYCKLHGAPGGVGMAGIITVVGATTQRPPADFDGNGSTDISVFRPSAGQWLAQGQTAVSHGINGDIPVPADYDGNGRTDKAVYRPAVGGWYRPSQATVFFGLDGDVPVPGDYNGDGRADIAVFRPSVGGWYIQGQSTVFFGLTGDIPVPGDYDGNGTTDVAIFRPEVGGWYRNGAAATFFGLTGDIPVPGDYDGNGTTDVAIFRPEVGGWYRNGGPTTFLGASGDIPVPGAYDANTTADVAVFRPSSGQWFVSGGGAPVSFGLSSDIPLPIPAAIRAAAFP
jgi:plastocyanin